MTKLTKKGAALLACTLLLAGCGKKELPDAYVEGRDYQYMQSAQVDFAKSVQKGPTGYYFLLNEFVYYYDQESGSLLPLCNKAECLHDMDSDENKMKECNAYAGDADESFDTDRPTAIFFCNGYIYYMVTSASDFVATGDDVGVTKKLYRVTEDGSQKECIHTWDNLFSNWIVHRDTLYYSCAIYDRDDDRKIKTNRRRLYSLDLTKRNAKPETVFTTKREADAWEIAGLCAYGNHVYFETQGALPEGADSAEDNPANIGFNKGYVYDTKEKKCPPFHCQMVLAKKGT